MLLLIMDGAERYHPEINKSCPRTRAISSHTSARLKLIVATTTIQINMVHICNNNVDVHGV